MRPRTLLDADAVDVNGFELQGFIQHKKVCGVVVATSWERFEGISWIGLIIIVTLLSLRQAAPQQSKASFDCIRFALSLHQIYDLRII